MIHKFDFVDQLLLRATKLVGSGRQSAVALLIKEAIKAVNAVLVVIAGHVYHVPLWLAPVAAIAYPGSILSVRLGKTIITIRRKRR